MAQFLEKELFEGLGPVALEMDVVLLVEIGNFHIAGKLSVDNDVVHAGGDLAEGHPRVGRPKISSITSSRVKTPTARPAGLRTMATL